MAGAGTLAACACGEGVVPGDAYDRPSVTFGGIVAPAGQLGGASQPIVGVLWTDPRQIAPDVPSKGRDVTFMVDTVNDRYEAAIFRPPPDGALVELIAPSGDSSRLAFGELVLVDDLDRDGTFSVSGQRAEIAPPDVFLAAASAIVRYVALPFSTPQPGFPLGNASAIGYTILDLQCSGPLLDTVLDRGILGMGTTVWFHVDMTAAISQTLPQVRTCARSHSP